MKAYETKLLPIDYIIDKDLFKLIAEANVKYGEYKSLLNTLPLEVKYFLDSMLLTESYKSTQIEGTQITQDEMYYLKYMQDSDDKREIENLKKTIEYAYDKIKDGALIEYELVNKMHSILLDSVRGANKEPGKIRTIQNWIAPRGVGIEAATFIPPIPEQVYGLLINLYEYMNNEYIDPFLVNVAISHFQFETIHAYQDGNGRLGRALIPVQMAMLDSTSPILFMSEVLELYKPSYGRSLMDARRGDIGAFIKFFLQCVIEQCQGFIYKIERIKTIYDEDMKTIESINSSSVYRIMPIISKQIVFTKKEIQEASGISVNTVSKIINQLVELGILVKDDKILKKAYRYQRIYELFVGQGY